MADSLGSDNFAGVHPEILDAIIQANTDHIPAYGDDSFTHRASKKFKESFGSNAEVYFVFGGTGANVLALKTAREPFHAVFCAESAHINVDECGAVENFTGSKLIPIPTQDGKLIVSAMRRWEHGIGNQHHVQPKIISISQPTELGTVYRREEVQELAEYAHQNGLFLHMDGARRLQEVPHTKLTHPVETNAVFVTLPRQAISTIQMKQPFYIWNEVHAEVRLMASFDTTEQDIEGLCRLIYNSVTY